MSAETSVRLTPLQREAVSFIRNNPRATVGEICRGVGVQGGDDNQAKFIARLINKGVVYLAPDSQED